MIKRQERSDLPGRPQAHGSGVRRFDETISVRMVDTGRNNLKWSDGSGSNPELVLSATRLRYLVRVAAIRHVEDHDGDAQRIGCACQWREAVDQQIAAIALARSTPVIEM